MGRSLQLEHNDGSSYAMCTLLITRSCLYSLYVLQLPTLHSSISHLTLHIIIVDRVSRDSYPSSFADSALYPIEKYIVKGVQYPPKMAQQEQLHSHPNSIRSSIYSANKIKLCTVYNIMCISYSSKFSRGSLFAFFADDCLRKINPRNILDYTMGTSVCLHKNLSHKSKD